jgi:hypothetical protein
MTFRILSLDGGGPWSLIQIMTLSDLYRSGGALLTGHQVLRDFDLVVANSGGSLILGGLIKDLPLPEIQKYFDDPAIRHSILPRIPTWRHPLTRLVDRLSGVGPRYSAAAKLEGLRALLNAGQGESGVGDLTLDGLKTRTKLPTQIMVAAFDYDRRRSIYFRSNLKSRAADFAMPAIATLAEAIHASTTAPIDVFDAPASVSRGRRCWDGAVGGANNPVLAGIAEALANGIEPQAIQVLSIGSGSLVLPLAGGNEDQATGKLVQRRTAPSRARDLKRFAQSVRDDPSDGASLLAHLALGQGVPQDAAECIGEGALVRMNPLIQPIHVPNGWVRPAGLIEAEGDGDEFVRLRDLPYDALRDADIALIRKFCTLWHNDAVVNQPIRANADTFACEIGHRWYSDAKAQWQALSQARSVPNGVPGPTNIGPSAHGPGSAAPRSMPPTRLGTTKNN